MIDRKKFNALTPQQREKYLKIRRENPHMPSEEVYARTKETKYVSKAQREAFERIEHINRLQKPELIELALRIACESV